jgi:hypothetical protein
VLTVPDPAFGTDVGGSGPVQSLLARYRPRRCGRTRSFGIPGNTFAAVPEEFDGAVAGRLLAEGAGRADFASIGGQPPERVTLGRTARVLLPVGQSCDCNPLTAGLLAE